MSIRLFKSLLLLALLLFSFNVNADWEPTSSTRYADSKSGACTAARSAFHSSYDSFPNFVYYITSVGPATLAGVARWRCTVNGYSSLASEVDITPIEYPVYNAVYTNEQCQSQYGGYGRLNYSQGVDSSGGGSVDSGACSTSLAQDDDIECYDRPSIPTGGFCYGNRVSTSTGENNLPSNDGSSSGSDDDSLPDYLTPDPDCQVNCVTFDGTTYKVDQSAIDDGYVNSPDLDNSGGGSDDGGSSGGSGGGDSGSDDGSDGGSSGGGSDGGDSGGSGGGGSGGSGGGSGGSDSGAGDTGDDDGLGLGDVIDAINDGFNGLVDTFTDTEGAPSENEIREGFDGEGVNDDVMSQLDEDATAAQGDLNDRFRDYFTNEGSALGQTLGYVRDKVTGLVPEVSSGGCTPLVFGSGERSFTIDCEHFNLIKAALAWLLYFFTAYQVTAIAFSYRNGSEA
ncbi:hypothetical protein [Chromohalobacter japonicus]|uniref:hypothetical protein n=1 Tax=Chromohalobacter japonicus TaxID=223900 RepID=UPI001FF6BD90|nr:hypothetical protein [Chromohalobacter japonicus]MCK0753475.1 hypothetical protein [Chromohalobacter japonicus]